MFPFARNSIRCQHIHLDHVLVSDLFSDFLAFGKPVFQSSEHRYWNTPASKAVDLSTEDNFLFSFLDPQLSCSRTEISENPWFVVDLGQEYWIHDVIVLAPETARGQYTVDKILPTLKTMHVMLRFQVYFSNYRMD